MSTLPNASTDQLIDRVVREVLARLQSSEGHRSTDIPFARSVAKEPQPSATKAVALADRVISVETLAQLPQTADRVQVEPGAVITPAARDLARERGIAWVRQGEMAQPGEQTLLIADTDNPARAAGLGRQLASRQVTTESIDPESLVAQVRGGRAVGLVLSDLPAGFICNACRHKSVRAACISELNELQPIAAQMQPNLWVIDMRRASLSKATVLAERCVRMASLGGSS